MVRVRSECSLEECVGLVLHVLVVVAESLGIESIWIVVVSSQYLTGREGRKEIIPYKPV